MIELEYVVVGLLAFLSRCRDCIGEERNGTDSSAASSGDSGGDSSGDDAESESTLWTRPAVISGGSAAIGLVIVLVVMIMFIICKYRYRYKQRSGSQAGTKRATTFRRRKSTKASQNGSNSIVNKGHNYETVLPNFSPIPKEPQAQNYEVPLSQSGTLQRNTTDIERQHSLTMKETHSMDKTTSSSSAGPIYMNYRHPDTCLQSRSLVNRPYMEPFKKESIENLSYVDYSVKMVTSGESWAV